MKNYKLIKKSIALGMVTISIIPLSACGNSNDTNTQEYSYVEETPDTLITSKDIELEKDISEEDIIEIPEEEMEDSIEYYDEDNYVEDKEPEEDIIEEDEPEEYIEEIEEPEEEMEDSIEYYDEDNYVEDEELEEDIEEPEENIVDEPYEYDDEEEKIEKELSKEDQIKEYFNNLKDKISNNLNKETFKEYKEKAKQGFITCVDFIFYDKEIKGITFDELKEGTKQEILDVASTIDNLIMKKFPNYKEEISEKTSKAYSKASELIQKGKYKLEEYAKEKLGEEKYDDLTSKYETAKEKVKDKYEEIKEETKETAGKIKKYIKNKYEGLR